MFTEKPYFEDLIMFKNKDWVENENFGFVLSDTKRISYKYQHRARFCVLLIASSNKSCHHQNIGKPNMK